MGHRATDRIGSNEVKCGWVSGGQLVQRPDLYGLLPHLWGVLYTPC